jgi:hypothetical protein
MNTLNFSTAGQRRIGVCTALALMVSLGFFTFLVAATARAQDAAQGATDQAPKWLQRAFGRDYILVGKEKSNTLDVHYLQTPAYFSDIRIPFDRPDMSTARSFADLTDAQLRSLADQNGSSGLTRMEGIIAHWHHDMDFQPSDGTPDQGRLERIPPDQMHEHGLDGSYTEAWRSTVNGNGHFLVVRVEHSGRLVQSLVVVDNLFVYARNRAKDLPVAKSFDALIAATKPSREQLIGYLECEFSIGHVKAGGAPWVIEKSTLPWRQGQSLDFLKGMSVDALHPGPTPRLVGGDQWSIPANTMSAGEIKGLVGG